MNDRIKELVSEILSMDETLRKEFEFELRTGKKEITANKKETLKQEKEKNKINDEKYGREMVSKIGIGGEILVDYKSDCTSGKIVKISEKTFTIEIENLDGKKKNLFRYYHQVSRLPETKIDDVTQE